jgi:drug/metabolite transporter (DMT)-like permease
MNWLTFALMTVVSWGVYGIFLHMGQVEMKDAVNGRYKAFLFVGLAYFLTAVLAPIATLMIRGADWNYPKAGMTWSLIAGIVGALGAFCVLLAFGAKGTPSVVMSIVFAGAPIVTAVVRLLQHKPPGGYGSIKPLFYVGILLAALGGCLVSYFGPPASAPAKPAAAAPPASAVK